MPETRDWSSMWQMSARLLQERTGQDVAAWNQRIAERGFKDEPALRQWLGAQGVTGYAQTLLVMERFGYPDWYLASADQLIEAQYADRPHLFPVYEAVIAASASLGDIVIQARKTYVSLLTPRRTFARLQPATRQRLDLALRLEGLAPTCRLVPSRIHESMPLQISLTSPEEVDAEVLVWLQKAYDQNR